MTVDLRPVVAAARVGAEGAAASTVADRVRLLKAWRGRL